MDVFLMRFFLSLLCFLTHHSFTPSLPHSLTHTHWLAHSLLFSCSITFYFLLRRTLLTHSLIHSLTHSLVCSLTCLFTHSLTHSHTHSLTQFVVTVLLHFLLLTHSLTHPLCHYPSYCFYYSSPPLTLSLTHSNHLNSKFLLPFPPIKRNKNSHFPSKTLSKP